MQNMVRFYIYKIDLDQNIGLLCTALYRPYLAPSNHHSTKLGVISTEVNIWFDIAAVLNLLNGNILRNDWSVFLSSWEDGFLSELDS